MMSTDENTSIEQERKQLAADAHRWAEVGTRLAERADELDVNLNVKVSRQPGAHIDSTSRVKAEIFTETRTEY